MLPTQVLKRSHQSHSYQEESNEVDDLLVAASFAQIPFNQATIQNAEQKMDGPQIRIPVSLPIDVSSDSDESCASDEENKHILGEEEYISNLDKVRIGNTEKGDSDSDSGDESEVDLREALNKMTEGDDDVDEGNFFKVGENPKTEHEIDAYTAPLEELQSKFQINLTVEEEEHRRLENGYDYTSSLKLCPAGYIACHMVEDRTIVVESTLSNPLAEGSLLVLRVPNEEDSRLIPLGKIFEIFGPVSRPFYTIRLPSSPSLRVGKAKTIPNGSKAQIDIVGTDENEISLSDSEDVVDSPDVKAKSEETMEVPETSTPPSLEKPDDWSPSGRFTTIVASVPRQLVFYIDNEATLLDTFSIMKNSGKGCDASNFYDEEVLNANDLYFSDDEEERQFKLSKKKGRIRSIDNRSSNPRIPGFHSA
jgi:rRNA processing protein Gar1